MDDTGQMVVATITAALMGVAGALAGVWWGGRNAHEEAVEALAFTQAQAVTQARRESCLTAVADLTAAYNHLELATRMVVPTDAGAPSHSGSDEAVAGTKLLPTATRSVTKWALVSADPTAVQKVTNEIVEESNSWALEIDWAFPQDDIKSGPLSKSETSFLEGAQRSASAYQATVKRQIDALASRCRDESGLSR